MEKMWYYVKDGTDRQGPIAESELRALSGAGEVAGADLVWTEGQSDWRPMNTFPEFGGHPAPAAAAPVAAPFPAAYAAPQQIWIPPGLGGWMTFVGVMNILGGALTCLLGLVLVITIIGPLLLIPLGVILILSGTALTSGKQALESITTLDESGTLFLEKIKRYMLLMGVLYIINIVLTVLQIIAVLVLIFGMGMSITEMMGQGASY